MTNFERIETLVSLFKNSQSKTVYNQIAEELLPYVTNYAHKFQNKFNFPNVDVDLLISIGCFEALNKAIETWDETAEVTFRTRHSKIMQNLFINEAEKANAKKRTLPEGCTMIASTYVDENGTETSVFDTIEDTSSRISLEPTETELLNHLSNSLSKDELDLINVLIKNQGKSRGQAVAAFFGKDNYDTALRMKVSRFQKKVKEVLLQMI